MMWNTLEPAGRVVRTSAGVEPITANGFQVNLNVCVLATAPYELSYDADLMVVTAYLLLDQPRFNHIRGR